MASTIAEAVRAGPVLKRAAYGAYGAAAGLNGDWDCEKHQLKIVWKPPIFAGKAASPSDIPKPPSIQTLDSKPSRRNSASSSTSASPLTEPISRSITQTSTSTSVESSDTRAPGPGYMRSRESWANQRRARPVPDPIEALSREAMRQRVRPNPAEPIAQATRSLVAARRAYQRTYQPSSPLV